MYNNIIINWYGSIIDIKTDEKSQSVWDKMANYMVYQGAYYSGEVLKERYERIYVKYMDRVNGTEYPEIEIGDIFYRLYRDVGIVAKPMLIRQTLRTFRAITIQSIVLNTNIKEVLHKLKDNKVKIYLMVNGQRGYVKQELKRFELKGFFEKVYISSDFGMKKPEVKFLNKVLKDNDLKKKQTLFIGNDYLEDIKMANNVGIDTLYIHTDSSNNKVKEEKCTYKIMDGDYKRILEILS